MAENMTREQAIRFATQQMASLARSGITDLPLAEGKYTFDFDESSASAPATASDNVKEKATGYRADKPGSQRVELEKRAAPTSATPSPPTPTPVKLVRTGLEEAYPASVPGDQRESALAVIQQEVQACMACPQLCNSRTQTVFGVGDSSAKVVFLGEGPGADEDRQGEPFVGAAGQLLNKIIDACKMKREDVYILNTVKCRPPANRNPSESELANCWNYAERQLEVLQPEFIVCLGSIAAKTLLQTKQSVGKMRQKFFQYRGSRVLVTYHPAYLLRNASAKIHVWNDMKLMMAELGVELD